MIKPVDLFQANISLFGGAARRPVENRYILGRK